MGQLAHSIEESSLRKLLKKLRDPIASPFLVLLVNILSKTLCVTWDPTLTICTYML